MPAHVQSPKAEEVAIMREWGFTPEAAITLAMPGP